MSYPYNTYEILAFLGYVPEQDFSVHSNETGITDVFWSHTDPEPAEQQIIDAGNSPEFAVWYAEHGGNQVLTLRRQIKEKLDGISDEDIRHRAAFSEVINEFNRHADKINAILAAIYAANSIADLRTRISAIDDYPQRTLQQLNNLVKTAIDNGDFDN